MQNLLRKIVWTPKTLKSNLRGTSWEKLWPTTYQIIKGITFLINIPYHYYILFMTFKIQGEKQYYYNMCSLNHLNYSLLTIYSLSATNKTSLILSSQNQPDSLSKFLKLYLHQDRAVLYISFNQTLSTPTCTPFHSTRYSSCSHTSDTPPHHIINNIDS
jgi:hypothetical protein